jgi:hypothetical protein
MATTTKKTSPTKMATTAIKKKKAPTSKRSTLTPNSYTYRARNDGSGVYKATDDKGKYNYISTDKYKNKEGHSGKRNTKLYTAFTKPMYTVESRDFLKDGSMRPVTKHFEKSIDTTGFAAGKKNFTVVSKQKLPGGNMYKTTKSKTDRKGALDTINRMKKRARKPFTSSKATSSKQLTTKKK